MAGTGKKKVGTGTKHRASSASPRAFREVTAWGYDHGTDAIDLIAICFGPTR